MWRSSGAVKAKLPKPLKNKALAMLPHSTIMTRHSGE